MHYILIVQIIGKEINMPEEWVGGLIPAMAVLLFLCAFVYVRRTNPENKKIQTRTSLKALMQRERCPKCGTRMKKKWVTRSLGLSNIEADTVYEREAQPEFICIKCNYKIKATFH